MKKGIVYILTNPCLDGWIKIGMSNRNDIEARLAELNRPTNIPLSYRAYAIYEVENPEEVEANIHRLFDAIDESLHAIEKLDSGRLRVREFFHISPEKAYSVFMSVAKLRGDVDNLKLVMPSNEQIEEERIATQGSNRPKFKFSMINIPIGTELKFLYDDSCVCTTIDLDNKICYEENEYSLTGLARKLLVEKKGWKEDVRVAGPNYFTFEGNTLTDIRRKYEDVE